METQNIVEAARIRYRCSNGASVYTTVAGLDFRISDHLHWSGHASSAGFPRPDASIVIAAAPDAAEIADAMRGDRTIEKGIVLPRRPRERATTTARALREAIAKIWRARRAEDRAKQAKRERLAGGELTAKEVLERDHLRAEVARFEALRTAHADILATVPARNTAGRRAVRLAAIAELRRRGVAEADLASAYLGI